ncbi:hypothetical protein A2U01_0059996, partial [Trifolium medium]|nr:hypothetical protein [Trifolium medium]
LPVCRRCEKYRPEKIECEDSSKHQQQNRSIKQIEQLIQKLSGEAKPKPSCYTGSMERKEGQGVTV